MGGKRGVLNSKSQLAKLGNTEPGQSLTDWDMPVIECSGFGAQMQFIGELSMPCWTLPHAHPDGFSHRPDTSDALALF